MALLDKPIEVAFVADDSQIQAVMARVGKQSEAMGGRIKDSSEAGRLGMWSLGESAENMAQRFGVPNKMAKQLGNSVERMAASMGAAAVALGVVGLAAMAAYAIWSHLNSEKEKANEELKKSVEALLQEETALAGTKFQTQELRMANERLRDVKQEILDQDFAKFVENEREEIKKLREEADKGGGVWFKIMTYMKAQLASGGESDETWAIYHQKEKENKDKLNRDADLRNADLAQKEAQRNANKLSELDRLNEEEKKRYYDADAMRTYFFQQDMKRAEEERAMLRMREQAYWDMAGSVVNSFRMLYTAGGSQARKWFTLWKIAAISEATVKGIQSVINSYEFGTKIGGPAMGSAMAAVSALAVYAKINALQRTEFGGGAAAVGTFPAEAGTGLPQTNALGTPTQVTININGRQAGMYELAGGVLRELDRNNGSIDGYSISVERSA